MTVENSQSVEDKVRKQLMKFGLVPLGWFEEQGKPALLIGNIGSSLWPAFSNSPEYTDGLADPLNRWTSAAIESLRNGWDEPVIVEIRYPFGEPNWPFQDYAHRAMGIEQSPIGLFIHWEYGLWTAFRAVLVFEGEFEFPAPLSTGRPCDTCQDKPCLTSCPISAFTAEGYDFRSCKHHVASQQGTACLSGGCAARQACPVGQNHAYQTDQQAFHMKAYI